MCQRLQNAALVGLIVLTCMLPAAAQVTVGEDTSLSLGGSLAFGYSGAFSSTDGSNHGLDFGGTGSLHGFYYDPRFLSFDFQPYYRRSQSNSIYQSITNDSGFTGGARFFSGSHFPGSISYSSQYNTTGQFGVPGISGITSHGNGHSFGVTWSALLPDLPTLTTSYSIGSGSSSVYGANNESESSSRVFSLQSSYTLADFQLQGQYTHLALDASFPGFLNSGEEQGSSTGSNTFNFNAGHRLPLDGYWSLGWNRSSYQGEHRSGTVSGSNDGVSNDLNTMVSLNPVRKLGLGFGAEYNDNVYGNLQQRILEAGGGLAPLLPKLTTSSSAVSVYGQAGYSVFSHLALYARASHRELWLPEGNRGLTQFSGNAAFNYAQRFLGALSFSAGVIDTVTQDGHSGASLVGNVNYLRRLNAWELGGNFAYTQQVQTLADVYTTSMYSYGASAKRRFGNLHWVGSFNGSHSGLTQFEGFSSRSEGFSSSLFYHRYSVSGHYSQSTGTSILTPGGLAPLPPGVPAPLLLQPILYNARSYGLGASLAPLRRCVLSTSFANAHSDTLGPLRSSVFQSNILNARFQYRFRKLDFDANFTRFQQSVTTGALPAVVNSYYFRISRWFNVF